MGPSLARVQRTERRPPPWDFYQITPSTVLGLATAEPYGATRWRL